MTTTRVLRQLAFLAAMTAAGTACGFFEPPAFPTAPEDAGESETEYHPGDAGEDTDGADAGVDADSNCELDDDCDEHGSICENSACIPWRCEPLATRCVGDTAQRCDARGARWEHVVDCAIGCSEGVCDRPACELSNNGVEICDGLDNDCNGTRDDNACPVLPNTTPICLGEEGCTHFCQPGWFNVDDDMASNGCEAGCVDSSHCPETHFCEDGSCIPDRCDQGVERCMSDSVHVRCTADGREELRSECFFGCVQNACVVECSEDSECGPDRQCRDGLCVVPSQCVVGTTVCGGGVVSRCDSTDGEFTDIGECACGCNGDACRICPDQNLVAITPAAFEMGVADREACAYQMWTSEYPQLEVLLTRPYSIAPFETTQREWLSVFADNPSHRRGSSLPVNNVSPYEAMEYANRLSLLRGFSACYELHGCAPGSRPGARDTDNEFECDSRTVIAPSEDLTLCTGFRLPTEAEWEFAYRAGTTDGTYAGDLTSCLCGDIPGLNAISWFCGNAEQLQSVGGRQPNGWDLYDMAGNVEEFCHDYFRSTPPAVNLDPTGAAFGGGVVARGGSYLSAAYFHRAAARTGFQVNGVHPGYGFRIAQSTTEFECTDDDDCDSLTRCRNGECRPASCDVGATACTPPGILTMCDSGGDGMRNVGTCPCGCDTEQRGCARCSLPDLVAVDPGAFDMGSPAGEANREPDETLHHVEITRPYSLLRTEVTQRLWLRVVGTEPSYLRNYDAPVEQVTAEEVYAFLNQLSLLYGRQPCYLMEGCTNTTPGGSAPFRCDSIDIDTPSTNPLDCEGFRLPTEAEWEFAYRAGTQTAYYNGDHAVSGCDHNESLGEIAWYCGSDEHENVARPVGTLEPNNFGLYDMAGNVQEMCGDRYSLHDGAPVVDPIGNGTLDAIVVKGGYVGPAEGLRAAARSSYPLTAGDRHTGFRIALSGHQVVSENSSRAGRVGFFAEQGERSECDTSRQRRATQDCGEDGRPATGEFSDTTRSSDSSPMSRQGVEHTASSH